MRISLIPILDVDFNSDVAAPRVFPYWEHQDEWAHYRIEKQKLHGLSGLTSPRLHGAPFYVLADIEDNELAIIIRKHTEGFGQDTVPLYGGYLLHVDGSDIFFPQCCGDLGDWAYWEKIASGVDSASEGHPQPSVTFSSTHIYLDFGESEDGFQPAVHPTIITLEKEAMVIAVEKLKAELEILSKRFKELNIKYALNFSDIDRLLIWGKQ